MSNTNLVLKKLAPKQVTSKKTNVKLSTYNVKLSVTDEIMNDIDTLTDMIYDFRGDIAAQVDQLYANVFKPLLEHQEDLKEVYARGLEVQESLKEIGYDIPLDFEAKMNDASLYVQLNFRGYEDAFEKLIYIESEQ